MAEERDTLSVEALLEANSTISAERDALRRSNSTLRKVIGILRRANESLRRQQSLQVENDEIFKYVCEHGFDASVTAPEAGLVEGEAVESAVANADEASEATQADPL